MSWIQQNWLVILMAVVFVIASILYTIYPQQDQSIDQYKKWELQLDNGVIIVVIQAPHDRAVKLFMKTYKNYSILEIYQDKNGYTWIKAKQAGGLQ